MTDKKEQFMQALDEHHQWPCPYVYKFIMPTENLSQFDALFPDADTSTKESRSGKYTSVTMISTMCSAAEVMDIYERAAKVPGLMSL